jgi:hypothetical protein
MFVPTRLGPAHWCRLVPRTGDGRGRCMGGGVAGIWKLGRTSRGHGGSMDHQRGTYSTCRWDCRVRGCAIQLVINISLPGKANLRLWQHHRKTGAGRKTKNENKRQKACGELCERPNPRLVASASSRTQRISPWKEFSTQKRRRESGMTAVRALPSLAHFHAPPKSPPRFGVFR